MRQDRILQQLDKMLASGRITEDEAAALRSASDPAEFDRAVGAIQARHAGVHMAAAIAAGDMTQEEVDTNLERLREGYHPEGLRARLSKHRRRADSHD
jgi:hypothetical protein